VSRDLQYVAASYQNPYYLFPRARPLKRYVLAELWNLSTREHVRSFPGQGGVDSLAFDPMGRQLAIGKYVPEGWGSSAAQAAADAPAQIWKGWSEGNAHSVPLGMTMYPPLKLIAWSPDGK
jgi:hypothetical protein